MKWLVPFIVCSLSLQAFGKKAEPPCEPPPAFDADLFRKDEQVFSGHLEFLYWTIEEGGLDYALKMKGPDWGPGNLNYASGNFETASYNFDPGFRLGLSFYRAERYWEIKWQYLRETFRGVDHASAPEASTEFLNGTWPQIFGGSLNGAKSNLHFNYNTFDMLIARVFIPNPHLRIRMLGGATTAWMSQEWVIRYTNVAAQNTRICNKWNYTAGGLKFGTTIDWYWSNDVYIAANGSIGLLMGTYHNHSRQTSDAKPAAGYDISIPLRDAKLSNIRPAFTAQMAFGPSWEKNYKCARSEVFVGYEITIWSNLQEIYRSTSDFPSQAKQTWINTSMLALHGLTARLSGDF